MDANQIYMIVFTPAREVGKVLTHIEGKICFPSKGKWPISPEVWQAFEVKVDKEFEKVGFISPISGPYYAQSHVTEGKWSDMITDILGDPDVVFPDGVAFGQPTYAGIWIRYSYKSAIQLIGKIV